MEENAKTARLKGVIFSGEIPWGFNTKGHWEPPRTSRITWGHRSILSHIHFQTNGLGWYRYHRVAQSNSDPLFSSLGHLSLKWFSRSAFLLEALGENPFLCLLQLPEATCVPCLWPLSCLQSQQYHLFRSVFLSDLCFHRHIYSDPDLPAPLMKVTVMTVGSLGEYRILPISRALT